MANKPKINSNINGQEYYRTRITIGHDEKGKPIRKSFYGSSKSDAENKKKQYIKDLEAGLNPDLAIQSLSQAMYTWLWDIEKRSGNKSSTFERYEGIYRNYIKDSSIGLLKISDINKLTIQKNYNLLQDEGKSYSQISNLHKLLNKFFYYAESEGYLIKNPCKGLKIPKCDEDKIEEEDKVVETFSQDELNILIDSIGFKKLRFIIMFAVLTGIRQGELLAIEKSDLTETSTVKINKTLRSIKVFDEDNEDNKKSKDKNKYELKVTRPKTKSSRREVPIPEILKQELKKLEKLIATEKLKLGPAYIENKLLFPSQTGTYIDAKNLRRSWERALKSAGIPQRKFHALRHTYATRLFENGTSILTVSRLLGHSSIRTTEIYTHVLEDIKSAEVECLNNMFNKAIISK
jgi:integrase